MRICLYTSTAYPLVGGQEAAIDALAREYALRGHETVVLAPRPARAWRLGDRLRPYPTVRHPRFVSKRYFVDAYGWWLWRLHRRHRFDIVHCHGVYQPGYIAARLKGRTGASLVLTNQGPDTPSSSHRMTTPKLRRRHEFAVRQADALVAISQFTHDGYLELCPDVGPRIVDIPNGVDLEAIQQPLTRPADLDPAIRERGYFLFLGRLRPRKGVDVLLRALALLPHTGRVQLVIAGDGSERAKLMQLADLLKLKDRVRFVGMTSGETKTYLLQHARCLVAPTRTWEGLPVSILEGLAAARPVIASQVPGIVDVVQPERTGWLVPPDAPQPLADALRQALVQDDAVARMGRQAGEFAQRFRWSQIATEHLELYERLRGGAARRRRAA